MQFKRIIFILMLLSFGYFANAQNKPLAKLPVNSETKLLTYDKVQVVDGVAQSELYRRCLQWCQTFYKKPTDVIRERDSLGGKIVCKGRFKITNPPDKKGLETDAGLVQYTLTILMKEGKYKYTLTDINWKQQSYYPAEKWMDTKNQYYKPEFEYYLQLTDSKSEDITKALDKAMHTSEKTLSKEW